MDPLFIPEPSNKVRVILNTDAKNEADDQYAIVHTILTPLFDLRGIIPAHFGDRRGPGSLRASYEEVLKLLDLCLPRHRSKVYPGGFLRETGKVHSAAMKCGGRSEKHAGQLSQLI